jgi:hypothetical protein
VKAVDVTTTELEESTRARAARSFTTRRVPLDAMRYLVTGLRPAAGDLVLARVEKAGHHRRLYLPDGGRRHLFVGDEIIVAYGNRYAANQFEARVPRDLSTCHLAAGGGIAGIVTQRHSRIVRGPTIIQPIGLIASDAGGPPVNVANWALRAPRPARAGAVPVIALVGTGMDSGKTTTAAHLARGIVNLGLRVGYAKVTGTGAAGDPTLVADAGASPVLDFTDGGYVSTYRVSLKELLHLFAELVGHLQGSGVDVTILEVADGLFQRESAMLLSSTVVRQLADGVIMAGNDSMGAAAGASWLIDRGHRVLGLAGLIQQAPLQVREAKAATGLPVYRNDELSTAAGAAAVLQKLEVGAKLLTTGAGGELIRGADGSPNANDALTPPLPLHG